MYLTDLAFIEEGTPNYTEDGLVNFSKMRMVSAVAPLCQAVGPVALGPGQVQRGPGGPAVCWGGRMRAGRWLAAPLVPGRGGSAGGRAVNSSFVLSLDRFPTS